VRPLLHSGLRPLPRLVRPCLCSALLLLDLARSSVRLLLPLLRSPQKRPFRGQLPLRLRLRRLLGLPARTLPQSPLLLGPRSLLERLARRCLHARAPLTIPDPLPLLLRRRWRLAS
jgi:hypothetical protein